MTGSRRQPWWRRWFGTRSERAAVRYLRQRGFRILARNYRCPLGELDLVAADGRTVVFVEVRSTATDDHARPGASVNHDKQRRLSNLALHYLQRYGLLNHAARFDVLTVSWPDGKLSPTVVHHRDAFEPVGCFQVHR